MVLHSEQKVAGSWAAMGLWQIGQSWPGMRLGLVSAGCVVSIQLPQCGMLKHALQEALSTLAALEDEDGSTNRNLVAVPQSGKRGGAAVDQDGVGTVLVFDFAMIADGSQCCVNVGHQRVIEKINITL